MPEARCFLSKREWNRNYEITLKAGRILYDLFQVGPWRVNASLLAQLKNPFDFESTDNIFKKALLPDRGNESEYIYRNCEDNIFVIWNKPQTAKFNNFNIWIGATFREKLKLLAGTFASITPELESALKAFPIDELLFPVASKESVAKFKSNFPKMKDSLGVCKENVKYLQTFRDWSFGSFFPSEYFIYFIVYQFLPPISQLPLIKEYLAAKNSGASTLLLSSKDIAEKLLSEDKALCGMIRYPEALLTDPSLGHWDLYWPDGKKPAGSWYEEAKIDESYKGRDPARDIRDAAVCIDFGTTGTVVASRNSRGEVSLLRVGALGAEARAATDPKHYVNPTIIAVDDFEKTIAAWRDLPWRPSIRWEEVRSSHKAKAELGRHIKSSFYDIKTWAKGKIGDDPRALIDEKKKEFRVPIPAQASEKDITADFATLPLNPIELYAYFIGLALNNQSDNGGRIFTEYYMTFPAAFDRETRDRILDGFRRGLLRSLPASLIYASDWNIDNFKISERASEPAALAAALLPLLKENGKDGKNIEPTDEGVAFGVFDFGGGTTDIAIGLYRNASEDEEEAKGWERVVDILDTTGDDTLGGEELTRLMIFEAVKTNRDKLISPDRVIPFERRSIYPHLPGDEELFSSGAIARENSYILGEKLRPVWEGASRGAASRELFDELLKTLQDINHKKGAANGPANSSAAKKDAGDKLTIEETFATSTGETAAKVKFEVDVSSLKRILKDRVAVGVEKFFTTFGQAMKREGLKPAVFHIILAGNSSQSPIALECFAEKIQEILNENPTGDRIILHPPLLPDPANPEAATLKTGVAIGLLNSLPGEATGMINRREKNGETAFPFTLGRLKQGLLRPILKRAATYGQWIEFGKVLDEGVNKFFYSSSPQALSGDLPRDQCREGRLNFGKNMAGKTILVMAKTPHSAAFAIADDKGKADEKTLIEANLG